MSENISKKVQKCLDAYKALSKDDQASFRFLIVEDEQNRLRNAPVDPEDVLKAVADFKSITLKVESSWFKNKVDTYKIVKKKDCWEHHHKDNRESEDSVISMTNESAESLMKKVFELGVLNWNKVFWWNNCITDYGVWTLDIVFKKLPKVHMKFDGSYPDKWTQLTSFITNCW